MGCNKTWAVLLSCELGAFISKNLETLLEDPRIPPEVAEEYAEQLRSRYLDVEYRTPRVNVDLKQ